ncbi:MAG: ferric reductase-like transmembrane domain-containing protein [Dermatophilaceae bacterium]
MSHSMLWLANRGTGVVLLVLLTLSMMIGVLSTSRISPQLWPRMLSQGLHRNVSTLAVTFLAAHTLTAVLDSYIDVRWWNAILPFTGAYRQPWLGLAALSTDLLIAVALTSVLRHRMSHRPWRGVHVLAYTAWALGLIHGMQGTDSATVWGAALNYGSIAAVSLAVLSRIGLLAHSKLVAA